MAFTVAERIQWMRNHPERRRVYQRRWRKKVQRQAEIEGAKQVLLSAFRLRTIGLTLHWGSSRRLVNVDSWEWGK